MAYRYGNRYQQELFPLSIEDYVEPDAVVRAYDAFVNALDTRKLGIIWNTQKEGNPQYDPKAMLKLFTYGLSYGFRSSRKLERATHYDISFIWLMGGLKPDHKTISEFRRNNKPALKNILKQCAQLCIKLDLIEGSTLFTDGSKIRGNVSIKHTWDKEKCETRIEKIEQRIEAILNECAAIDDNEQNQPSLVKLTEELKDNEALRAKVIGILQELDESGKKSINSVDPECVRFKSIQGSHSGYNLQTVVDEKHGLIVNADVVSENNDVKQFANQINQANDTLGKKCDVAVADAGYFNVNELDKIAEQKIKVIVPSIKQASGKEPKEFEKERFTYDPEKDCYVCPEGHTLKHTRFLDKQKQYKEYMIEKRSLCHNCRHFKVCTTAKAGRKVLRHIKEEIKQKYEQTYKQEASQKIYALRKQKVELPFGHMKRNLAITGFLLRGREGVKAESALAATCFNLTRMITILGVSELITKLNG